MIWDKIKKQKFAVRVLTAHMNMKRLASTYLISGEEESGKEDMALAFAMALNCQKQRLFEPCECSNCARIAKGSHPDVRWLGHPKEEKSIKIESVREMLNWVYLKPYESAWKVFLIEGAERLTIEASNALLKTLEEPSERTVFCLLVENKSHLLDTIQSRAFELKLYPLGSSMGPDMDFFKQELPGLGTEAWENFLESYQNSEREDFQRLLVYLMYYFREKIQLDMQNPEKAMGPLGKYLDAVDAVYETAEALHANANQKLSVSRLAMQLKTIEV